MKKIACSFFYTDDRYKHLADLAIQSFKTWHPDIDVFIFDKNNIDLNMPYNYTAGYTKFYYASTLFRKGYNKVISLGVDTVTCGRLDEFINNEEDVLTTLDFNYGINFNGINIPADHHYNADVICFNNKFFIFDLLRLMRKYANDYFEQGALNQMLAITDSKYSYKNVDYMDQKVVYNCRAYYRDEGNNNSFHGQYPYPFRVEEDKLISPLEKIVKIIHFVKGFGTFDKPRFVQEINSIKDGVFNEETKKFIIEKCGVPQSWFDTKMTEEEYPENLKLHPSKTNAMFPRGDKLKFDGDINISDYLNKKLKKIEL